ncbi:hypothetical protein CEP54_013284 [Fusarium duplospermum]|uniref:SnoaL-like domain-containing protein n=1 Tax=Fusarium duplospermum TaxID=1325734 RepID=A0A428P3Q0_9HYPO|nr:hypothetical protein CEP54_013284 [Fusarium duplospermum]
MAISDKARLIISRWTGGWSVSDQSDWVKLHTQDVVYTDHAFQMSRTDHDGLKSHTEIWKGSIPDFVVKEEHIWLEESLSGNKSRLLFKTVNTGTFVNDLPGIKATGRPFWFPGVVELIVHNEDELIEKIEEWYTFSSTAWPRSMSMITEISKFSPASASNTLQDWIVLFKNCFKCSRMADKDYSPSSISL